MKKILGSKAREHSTNSRTRFHEASKDNTYKVQNLVEKHRGFSQTAMTLSKQTSAQKSNYRNLTKEFSPQEKAYSGLNVKNLKVNTEKRVKLPSKESSFFNVYDSPALTAAKSKDSLNNTAHVNSTLSQALSPMRKRKVSIWDKIMEGQIEAENQKAAA